MAVFTHLETDTGTNADISSATAIGAYTATADKLVMVDVSIDQVAGDGDYVMYVTRQINGSGSAYRILPQTTMAAASGLTAISAQSGWITVRNGDVLTVYVDGLAGDTSTPDWTTRWFELAGVTAAAVADAVLDEATSGHTSAGSFSKAVMDILADTGTDGVKINATQGAITWGQQKIVANVANEGALDIRNSNSEGFGQHNEGGSVGLLNLGASTFGIGQVNSGEINSVYNEGQQKIIANVPGEGALDIVNSNITGAGQHNKGGSSSAGLWNEATVGTLNDGLSIGLVNSGSQAVNGYDPALALEATLTAIKGAGWTTETLAVIDVLIDAIKAKTDLLDVSSVTVNSAISGTAITILRGDTFECSISGLGSLASYVSLDFTVKANKTQADTEALIRIRLNATGLTDGLLTLNGATPSSADDGSIAITDAAAGDITITLAASCTDDLATGTYAYDVQLIEVGDVSTLTSGKATVIADVTRAVA